MKPLYAGRALLPIVLTVGECSRFAHSNLYVLRLCPELAFHIILCEGITL